MPTQIELLASLQILDQSLRTKTQEVEESESRVAILEEGLRTKSVVAETLRSDLAAVAVRQRDLEGRLAAAESKLKDRRMRITRIRNEKELGLAKREVDLLKEETSGIETELLTVLEQAEAASAQLRVLEDELGGLRAAIEGEAAELKATLGRLGGEIERERNRRESLISGVDGELRRRYETILSRRGGLAVVEIRDGTCQGCHMHVPPQLFNLIQRNDEVILCPNCQRMLYWRRDREDGGDSA